MAFNCTVPFAVFGYQEVAEAFVVVGVAWGRNAGCLAVSRPFKGTAALTSSPPPSQK